MLKKTDVEEILIDQTRIFSCENELVLHFSLALIQQHGFDANKIYFEQAYEIKFVKQTNGETHPKTLLNIDLVALKEDMRIGFEFKYCTAKFPQKESHHEDSNKMKFSLKEQSDNGGIRFGFRKDIHRLEKLLEKGDINKGFSILLTNDKNIWEPHLGKDTLDKHYRFRNIIPKEDPGWNNKNKSPENWTKKKEYDYLLNLKKDYTINWLKNSCIEPEFQFCVCEIE